MIFSVVFFTFDGFNNLWMEGNIENNDTWGADVESDYCREGNNGIPSSKLKGNASCNIIASFFDDCICGN